MAKHKGKDDYMRLMACKKILKKNILNLRLERKWTQLEASNQYGISEQSWRHIEKVIDMPRFQTLVSLCQLFDIKMTTLLEGMDEYYNGTSGRYVDPEFANNQRRERDQRRINGQKAGLVGYKLRGVRSGEDSSVAETNA